MKSRYASLPYLIWMLAFIVIPLLLIVFYGITVETDDGIRLSLENFHKFLQPVYLKVLLRSIGLALVSTAVCLVVGYPAAMILAGKEISRKNSLILLFVIPMWMNFLLRTYAWMSLLEKNGIINTFLSFFGIGPFSLLYNSKAVVLGMVYNFLPFMVLPIYSVLGKIDRSLVEAAQDLGADSFAVFKNVIFPLSIPGVMSGINMVFMPAVTTFVISRLLGGGQYMLFGNLIERQFLNVGDWHFGSTLSLVILLVILVGMGFVTRYEKENEGGGLW